MLNKKGQGTTEYLIILAAVIVIALVVVGIMGWYPKLNKGIVDGQTKAYWNTQSPIAITDWTSSSVEGTTLALKNTSTSTVTISEIDLDGSSNIYSSGNELVLLPGSSVTGKDLNAGMSGVCTSGQAYSYDVIFKYSVQDGLGDTYETGTVPINGICG